MDKVGKCPVCGASKTHAVVNDHWMSRDENNRIMVCIDTGCWCSVCQSSWDSLEKMTNFTPYNVKPHNGD